MTSSNDAIERLASDLRQNPNLIDQVLVDSFDLHSLLSGVENMGYGMSQDDIEAYLKEKFPKGGAMADMTYYVERVDGEGLSALSADEVEAVGGGVTVVAAVVGVVVAVYAAVLAVGAAVVFISTFAVGVVPELVSGY